MRVGARLYAEIEDGVIDFVAPSIEPLAGFANKYVHGWALNYLLDENFKKPIKTLFVDVGACIGAWGIIMGMNYPDSHVICVEPYLANYECLVYNAQKYKNVHAINVAADEKKGKIRLSLPDVNDIVGHKPIEIWNNYGLVTAYGKPEKKAVEVMAFPLDDIVRNVGVLKLDVEGMELRVLAGAQRILTEEHPLLQVEAIERNQKRAGHSVDELHDYIMSYGYIYIGESCGDNFYYHERKR